MKSKIFLGLFILHLFVGTCVAKSNYKILKEKESSDLAKAATKILISCYGNEVKTIGIAAKSPGYLITSLMSFEEPLPVININHITISMFRSLKHLDYRYAVHKLQLFAITAASSKELDEILHLIKHSVWWNHMAHFYILEWPVKGRGCSKAYEFLWTAWKKNLVKAKFMCTHRAKGRLIYTFNPYTTDAPAPWQLEAIYKGENDHPWALLVREYSVDGDTCENMDFDKTKNLGGYEIPVVTPDKWPTIHVDENKTGVDSLRGVDGNIMRSLFRSLNATVKPTVIQGITGIIGDYPMRVFGGILPRSLRNEVGGRQSYLKLIPTHLRRTVRMKVMSYAFYQDEIRAVTHYKGDKSQLGKIASVLDVSSRIGLLIVGLITLIFFKFLMRQTLGTALLNLIRIICNSAITNLPNNVASRIYVASLLILVVTIQGIYQGLLASLLAKRVPLKNIDTTRDLLADPNQLIFVGRKLYWTSQFLPDVRESHKFEVLYDVSVECSSALETNRSAACLGGSLELVPVAARENLHLSSEFMSTQYMVWMLPEDWPLEERFNKNLQRLVEAYIVQREYNEYMKDDLRTIEKYKNMLTDRVVKVFDLEDLGFAFVILGIGLGCGLICFIIENAMSRKRRALFAKILRGFWNRVLRKCISGIIQRLNAAVSGIRNFFRSFFRPNVSAVFGPRVKPPVLKNPKIKKIAKKNLRRGRNSSRRE